MSLGCRIVCFSILRRSSAEMCLTRAPSSGETPFQPRCQLHSVEVLGDALGEVFCLFWGRVVERKSVAVSVA
eukprot:14668507-Alexandrium_andersonii.AAC.1